MIGYGKGRGLFVFFGLPFRLPRPIITFYLPYHYFLLALSLEKYLLSTLGGKNQTMIQNFFNAPCLTDIR